MGYALIIKVLTLNCTYPSDPNIENASIFKSKYCPFIPVSFPENVVFYLNLNCLLWRDIPEQDNASRTNHFFANKSILELLLGLSFLLLIARY
jgi:hypothetical protein